MKKLIFKYVTKFQNLQVFLVLVLWALGALAAPFGFPWIVLGIMALHTFEYVTVGAKKGKKYGESFWQTVTMVMIFGYVWWVPLTYRNEYGED